MTNKEILIRSFSKAYKNGFINFIDLKDYKEDFYFATIDEMNKQIAIRDIIFNHDFAKAFWGECLNPDSGPLCIIHNCDVRDCVTWEYHLQQMVLEKEPLRYLEGFLDNCDHIFIDENGDIFDFCLKCNKKSHKI